MPPCCSIVGLHVEYARHSFRHGIYGCDRRRRCNLAPCVRSIGVNLRRTISYGDPLQREVEKVIRDVQLGYVSVQRARTHYGVVLHKGDVDTAATKRSRAAASVRIVTARVETDEIERFEDGRRIVLLSGWVADQAGLAKSQIAELIGKNGAPLRVWVETDDLVSGIRLGARACEVLQTRADETVVVRAPLV